MGWPQFVIIGWMMFILGIAASKHGQPREGNYSFFQIFFIHVIFVFVLYMGGFFS